MKVKETAAQMKGEGEGGEGGGRGPINSQFVFHF